VLRGRAPAEKGLIAGNRGLVFQDGATEGQMEGGVSAPKARAYRAERGVWNGGSAMYIAAASPFGWPGFGVLCVCDGFVFLGVVYAGMVGRRGFL
jgi:hypothetical protein